MEQTLSTTSKPIKIRGPDHPITIERNPNRVVLFVGWMSGLGLIS